MIVVLRGVPGSGKSTLARAIAPRLNAVILDKDSLRACVFPGDTVEYTTTQDDFVISLMLQAARYHLERRPRRPIFIDGRVFAVASQVEVVRQFAVEANTEFRVIECMCSRDSALRGIQADESSGTHLAKNRNAALLDAQLAKWEPVPYATIRIDTEKSLDDCAAAAITALSTPRTP